MARAIFNVRPFLFGWVIDGFLCENVLRLQADLNHGVKGVLKVAHVGIFAHCGRPVHSASSFLVRCGKRA